MKIVNFILFQAAWLITVFSAAYGMPYMGVIFTLLWMLFHLLFVNKKVKKELLLISSVAIMGWLLEIIMVVSSFISYPVQAMFGSPVPFWMVALWINLAATINFSLSWMKGRYFLIALFASVAGPLSYFAGERIGAINLNGMFSIIAISTMWFFAMPLIFWLNQFLSETKFFNGQVAHNGAE